MRRANLAILIGSTCLFVGTCNASEQLLKPFTQASTVNDFALECQHPAKKSNGPERNKLCVRYVNAAVQQVALAKKAPECWAAIDEGQAAPGPIMDVLFYLAAQPIERDRKLASALKSVITDVAVKACK